MTVIARVRSDFDQKFGVPRQSGLVDDLWATIVFEPGFRDAAAVFGLAGNGSACSPPAARAGRTSPASPSVAIGAITEESAVGPTITIAGADLVDGTPIFDVKPYIATDSRPDAEYGLTSRHTDYRFEVDLPDVLRSHCHREAARRCGLSFTGVDGTR